MREVNARTLEKRRGAAPGTRFVADLLGIFTRSELLIRKSRAIPDIATLASLNLATSKP